MTSPKPLKFEKKSRDREAIFLKHYDWLLDWARQHTQGATEEAEDLVQDLYVRFVQMRSGPTFTDDDQIRAYLYTSLKNLFISKKLRSGRDAVSGLLAVDFDSVAFAISAVDRSQLLYVRSDLAGICEYACIRRRTSRAASALILRFFLGYLSSEVMALLKAKRSNLDTLIEAARLEAKAYLSRPGVLRFLSRSERRSVAFPKYLPEAPEALFLELQRRIFSETEGACQSPEELKDRYLRPEAPGFSTQEVAHLASCRACLNRASQVLGLPDLMLRSFSEGDLPEGTNPPPASTGEENLKKLRRKLRETYEHRPKKLQIAVDGEVRGVQTITGASSKLQITLPPLSKPGFVEVLSEQGLGLLYFDLQQETFSVPAPRVAAVDLSDSRQLSVSLTLVGGALVIDVSYYDPLLDVDADGPPSAPAPVTESHGPGPAETREPKVIAPPKADSWPSRLLAKLKGRGPWVIATAVGFCMLIGLGLAHTGTQRGTKQETTAAMILAQSLKQTAHVVPPHGAVHQTFSLEIRSGGGTMIGTAEVDLLRSLDRPLEAVRLRTSSGNRVASHCVDRGGKARDFPKAGEAKPGIIAHAITLADKVWQHPPGAADFEQLAGSDRDLQLQAVPDGYEVSFKRPITPHNASIAEGHLVIASATMRPVAETLLVRSGGDTREYQFKELRYEVLRPEQIRSGDFDPESYVTTPQHGTNAGEDVHLILQVWKALSDQPPDLQTRIDVDKEPGGIEITGVLPTREGARSLIQSLRSLHGGSKLRVKLHSVDQPQAPHRISTIELSPPVSVVTDHIPLDGMLRESLGAESGLFGAELDTRVRQAAREILARSARVHRAAWVVSQIGSKDFRGSELGAMSVKDRQLWLTLLARPLTACNAELHAIDSTLAGERSSVPLSPQDTEPIGDARELAVAADSLGRHAEHLDRLLRTAFAISADSSSPLVRPAELLQQLSQIQREESRLEQTVHRLQQGSTDRP